jgi:hypothetical protein
MDGHDLALQGSRPVMDIYGSSGGLPGLLLILAFLREIATAAPNYRDPPFDVVFTQARTIDPEMQLDALQHRDFATIEAAR